MAINVFLGTRALLVVLVALMIAVGAGFAFAYLPSAVVTIQPATETRAIAQEMTLSTQASEPDFKKFVLPATALTKTTEESRVVKRDASTLYEDFARGTVVLVNERDEEQQLLPKTHLRHEETGTFFLTDSGVAIPPQGEIGVTVTAKDKGAAGNVPAGRFVIDKLAASLQSSVFGESTSAFSGGTAVEKPISEEEVAAARESLVSELMQRLTGELTADTGGAGLNKDLIDLREDEVEVSAEVGSKASEFTVRAKMTGRAFVVDETDVLGLALLNLRSAGDQEQEFVTYDPQSFSIQLQRADFDRGQAIVEGSLAGTFANKIAATALSGANLAGLTVDEAVEQLKTHSGVGDATVALSPFWVQTIPSRAGGVEIVVASSE